MTCTIVQKGLGTALSFYHHLRRKGYKHGSAVTSVLMYYSPSKEDLHKRLKRRRRYVKAQAALCTCCGRGREELEFEHTLEVFNQHGREAEPPFGGIVVNNGQVLVCNYRTISGRRVDGYVKNKEFITREVEVRKDWPKGEKGYEVYDV